MNINADISLRDRSRVTLGGFKGLDTLSAAIDVSAIHATEMKNLISRDGVNHKRYGWKTQFRIRYNGEYLKIQGIFNFTIYHEKFFIVYAGKKFWVVDMGNNGRYADITHTPLRASATITGGSVRVAPVDDSLLIDTECKCFMNGNKVYFVGCGDLLVFSKWTNDLFELRRVVGNEDVYIPTTTENIGCEEDGQHFTRITAEEKNILSPYHYNLLFGRSEMNTGDVATYYLDSNDFIDIEVEVQKQGDSSVVLRKTETAGVYNEGDRIMSTYITLSAITQTTSSSAIIEETSNGGGGGNVAYFAVSTLPAIVYFDTSTVLISVPSSITLVTMANGDRLVIKNTVNSYSSSYSYGTVNNVSVYYRKPLSVSFALVYIKADGTETYLQTVQEKSVTCAINSVNVGSSSVTISANITINYGYLSCDLTSKNAVAQTIHYGSYSNSGSIGLKDESGIYTGQVVVSEGKLVLNSVANNEGAYAPLVPDQPNIKVKLQRLTDTTTITTAKKACEFGAQGGTDRLFIVDNSGNVVHWSKDEDFTYFGEKSWCVCGTSDKRITGMDRLNDSTLLIVKEYSPREPSIFIITGNILTGQTEAGTVDYVALFTPHGYQVGMGAVGEIVNFNGDCLMVAKDGIYAVSLGENMTVDSRYILHRSRQISNKLEKFDLASAKCVSFDGKFLLYVGGEENEVYVADNKYTASFEGDIQNVVNYEWWRWTNIPVNVFGFVNNELWFGTEDGQLCSFTRNFFDETFSRLYSDLIDYDMDGNDIVGFVLHEDIKVKLGDTFTPTCDFYGGITTNKFERFNNETRFFLPLNDYIQGETIYIDNKPYTIEKRELHFAISYTTDAQEITFYRNYKHKPLKVIDETMLLLEDRTGQCPVWSTVTANGGLNPSITGFTATLSNKIPVVAKWVSGAMDLGTRTYSKSLTYLILTGEKNLANRIKYGLKTRFTHRDYELLRANNDLDFNQLDLQTVSMDSDFASSYVKKLNIRNINFLMFYFISDTAEDIALNSIQIEFKLYKRNIGVR